MRRSSAQCRSNLASASRCTATPRCTSRSFSARIPSHGAPSSSASLSRGQKVSDPNFEARIRESFSRQTVMKTVRAEMTRVAPGEVEIDMPYSTDICQQNGFVHAGIVTTIVDSACGYAAFTLMPADADVLSIEFKVNFISPAAGRLFRAYGSVLKSGKTITATRGEVWSIKEDMSRDKLVAAMQATMIVMPGGVGAQAKR